MVKYLDKAKTIAHISRSSAVITSSSFMPENQGTEDFTVKSEHASVLEGVNTGTKGKTLAPWGKNNLKPNYFLDLLSESNIMAQLLYTAVNFSCGHLYTFRWELKEGKDGPVMTKVPVLAEKPVRDLLAMRKTKELMRSRATDFSIHGNVWAKYILSRDGKSIANIEHVDAFNCRLAMKNPASKRIENHFVCSDWRKPKWKSGDEKSDSTLSGVNVREYPAFEEDNPLHWRQSLHHSKLYWSGQEYYGIQPWHSAHNWINYANTMPKWMTSNITKSFNIKYHIQYPESYFDYLHELFDTPEERQAEKERVFDALDEMLAGEENAQSTFFTSFQVDEMTNKEFGGWKIDPIQNDLKDDAFLTAFETSNNAMTSATGMDPSLAGIQMEGKMPPSGSEKRISYQLHEVLRTEEARKVMVEPLEIWRDVNGFDPEVQFGFLKRNVVTLAEDKGGVTEEIGVS